MLPEPGANNPVNPINSLVPLPGSTQPSPHVLAHPRGVVGRPPQVPPPTGLTRAPDAFLLLKALQRRWLLAGSLGLILAVAAATGVLFFIPPPKHSARTLLHVPPQRGIVFKHGSGSGDLQNHQRTQVAMLRSRLVLKSALRDPKVANLEIVQQQVEPVEWLEKEIEGDFSVAPEILRISMKGDKPEELISLVDAIAKAYQHEIVDNEKNQLSEKLRTLRMLREKYEGDLRDRQRTRREIEQSAGGRDATARALVLSFERQNLITTERQLIEARGKLREARMELGLHEERSKSPQPTIPGVLVDEQLDGHPNIVRLLEQAEQHEESLKKIREKFYNPEQLPAYQDHFHKLKKVQAALTAERKRLRPVIVRQLQEKMGQSTDAGSVLRARVTSLEGMEKVLDSEIVHLRKVVEDLAQNGSKLDAFQDDIRHIEDLTQRLIKEEQALNVELEVPSEFKVLEEAQLLHAEAKTKKTMMVGGAGAAAFAASLLGVAFLEFRRRRVSSVEDVSNDLGIRVLGVVPHSSPRLPNRLISGGSQDAYRTLVLAESVDTTRTLLLHLARGESAQVVMVTSAMAGEGKTSLACHLAASMARMGLKTLLIDADLRNPTTHRLFEIANDAGLSEVLLGQADISLVVRPTAVSGLKLLPAGIWDDRISRILAQGSARSLFNRLRKEYDFILVDSSPVLPVADTLLFGQGVDAVIFSVLCEVSSLPSIYTATQRMAALGIRNLGAVVNGVEGEPYVSSYAYTARTRGNVESEVSA